MPEGAAIIQRHRAALVRSFSCYLALHDLLMADLWFSVLLGTQHGRGDSPGR